LPRKGPTAPASLQIERPTLGKPQACAGHEIGDDPRWEHLAGVPPSADRQAHVAGRALEGEGAADRAGRSVEGGANAVARAFDPYAAVLFDGLVRQRVVPVQQSPPTNDCRIEEPR
jgi:hypothetical protein